MINEEWKDIEKYEGLYQVSTLGIIYDSMLSASQKLNIPPAHISRVCRGLRKSTRGYSFKYLEVVE